MSSNDTKKKIRLRSLEFHEKLEILNRLDSGEPAYEIARSFNIAPSTVSNIKFTRENIENRKEMLSSCEGNFKKKRFRGTEESLLESEVYKWLSNMRHTGVPVSGSVIKQVALNVHANLNVDKKFTASSGWVRRFCDRHGISIKNLHGEKLANIKASEAFKSSFGGLMELAGVSNLDHIYNCDETGLNWKLLPSKTYTMAGEKDLSGFKKSKIRITVMICTNASGTHKIPLHIIGKFQKPRCFNEMNKYSIKYSSQSSTWMNREIMMDWYENLFIPEVKKKHQYENNKNLKIILLMDNAPCHPSTDEFHKSNDFCTIIHLPPNTASILQPMDQGIIEKFKRAYWYAFLTDLLINKSSIGFTHSYKRINLSHAFHYSSSAWDQLTESDIRNCWKKLIPLDHDSSVSITSVSGPAIDQLVSMLPGCNDISANEIKEWLELDQYEPCFEIDSSIESPGADNATSDQISESETNSKNEEFQCDEDVSLIKVYDAINFLSRWSLGCNDPNLINFFKELKLSKNYIAEKILGTDDNK